MARRTRCDFAHVRRVSGEVASRGCTFCELRVAEDITRWLLCAASRGSERRESKKQP